MPITRINKLDEGLNELANPQTIEGLQESVNYEMLGDNKLTKRRDPVEYGDDVSGDSLKTKLAVPFTESILQISPPYYPVKKLSDMTGDFLILVYGQTGVDANGDPILELYMCYENDSNTWTVTKVSITGITYTSDTYLEFFVGDDKLIITDTYNETTNFPHYVKVDADGDLITGLFSIKSPTNKPTLLPTTEYDADEFEEDETAVRLDECGIIQCVYTVITEEGDESNPSPMSNSRMMQFFKKDLTDKTDVRWIDNFQITNLSVPVLTGDLTEQLKYFNVYFRVIRYSEGEAAEPFYFSQRFDIVDKESNEGDTGNGYLVSVPQDESIQISYENDIAPYAKHAAEVSGIVGFSNIREKTRFPFDFEKYCPIEVNNVNNKNFVDAIVKIRIYDENNTGVLDYYENQVDMISDLDLNYYNGGTDLMTNLNLIRIYDDDLITPIRVMYDKYNGAPYLDVYVKVPLLTAGQIKYLYLCFNTEDAEELGVTTTEYQVAEYGEFTQLTADNLPDMFEVERVRSGKSVICSPMDYQAKSSEIINLVDDNNPGEILGDYGSFSDEIATKHFRTHHTIGSGSYLIEGSPAIGSAFAGGADFSEIKYSVLPFSVIPDKIAMWGRIKYENLSDVVIRPIFAIYNRVDAGGGDYFNTNGVYLSTAFKDGDLRWALIGNPFIRGEIPPPANEHSVSAKLIFDEIPASEDGEVFICLSIDKEESVSLFVGNLLTGSYYTQKVAWEDWDIPGTFNEEFLNNIVFGGDVNIISIGYNGTCSGYYPGEFQFYISQFQLMSNKYYDAENDDDITAIYNVANFTPAYETAVGQKIITEE